MKILPLLLTLLLAGCALWAGPDAVPRPLAPAFGEYRSFQRDLTIRLGDLTVHYRVSLALTPERTRIRLLADDGEAVLTYEQSPGRSEISRTPGLPARLSADALIGDIQLAFWPEARLQRMVRPPWRLERLDNTLRLYEGRRLEARVSFQGDNPKLTTIPVYNARYDYLLLLVPPGQSAPSPSAPAPD
ncbi:MAG: DUF3261 domain-containing protein [Alcanivorax sp.]|uniref:DUF3261 domain-containing protein n=1 Tax=Alloalcanivorax marinus TaxID=1177169 RepID=A0A9Q3UN58_9GAMM|nr:DUF3261 domain-containing protein [Alloalcanivorax marinus]MBM7333258.1 DUF3261 domain-containing protein [Alloalcanivorax marinus]MCC4308344.1 DUF3261 domain-containing protein [Alloalcanivorax marinus]MCU5787103.1 hypothetical protein [Alloalcanivorax marinus]